MPLTIHIKTDLSTCIPNAALHTRINKHPLHYEGARASVTVSTRGAWCGSYCSRRSSPQHFTCRLRVPVDKNSVFQWNRELT